MNILYIFIEAIKDKIQQILFLLNPLYSSAYCSFLYRQYLTSNLRLMRRWRNTMDAQKSKLLGNLEKLIKEITSP
jgi:hypothetical protein